MLKRKFTSQTCGKQSLALGEKKQTRREKSVTKSFEAKEALELLKLKGSLLLKTIPFQSFKCSRRKLAYLGILYSSEVVPGPVGMFPDIVRSKQKQ